MTQYLSVAEWCHLLKYKKVSESKDDEKPTGESPVL